MKAKQSIITLSLAAAIGGVSIGISDVSALTYQTKIDNSFTINPSVSISLSSSELKIEDLTPGSASDSNTIRLTVETNNATGYTISSNVGNGTTYTSTNLKHKDGSVSDNFTSLATTDEVASLDNLAAGKWGYSFAINNGTWSSYSGLPYNNKNNENEYDPAPAELIDVDTNTSSIIDFKIAANAKDAQIAGEYNNVINFITFVKDPAPEPSGLYDLVAAMSKGTQTAADLQKTITKPTSDDYAEDTSNSGVYEYDSSVFGASSDASNDNKIYYYRGILEQTPGSYGSDGSATTYPNYVILSSANDKSGLTTTDTCWRIVRTTGSGGVKMIYNGVWDGTCAHATTAAQVATSLFNGSSDTYQQIVLVGYTYNDMYATNRPYAKTIAEVLGSDADPLVNNANSIIKSYIENTWFTSSTIGIGAYESLLEPSAGYCNDRTAYSDTSYALQSESAKIVTYGTSDLFVIRFGSNIRNSLTLAANNNRTITLNCARNIADLYTTASANGGNKQLNKPAALLTADEMAFAGSGSSTANSGSAYNAKSYLYSGSYFWSLSPMTRPKAGYANMFAMYPDKYIGADHVNYSRGVRPAISLTSGTGIAGGSGIATDPWIVNP